MEQTETISMVTTRSPSRWSVTRLRHALVATATHARRILRTNLDVAALLWRERPLIAVARGVVLVLMIATPFLMSWSTGQAVMAMTKKSSFSLFDLSGATLALSLVIAGALPLVLKVLDRLIEHWSFVYVQQKQVTRVPDLDPVTYSNPDLKDEIQKVQERAVWRIMAFTQSQLLLLRALALVVIAEVALRQFHPLLGFVVFVAMIPSMVMEGLHAYRHFMVDERQGDWWRRFWEDRRHILDSKSLAYLQVFDAAHWFAERFAKQISSAMEEYDVVERRSVIGRMMAMGIGLVAVVLAASVLIHSVLAGHLTIAAFVFNLGMLTLLSGALAELSSLLGQQFGQSLYVTSFQEVVTLESRTHFSASAAQPTSSANGVAVELSNVRFGYPQGAGKTQREVVRGVSLSVPAGEKWALVGVNGAGKTTLTALLVRLFDPDSGEVLIGGTPAKALSRSTLRRTIGCLPQQIQHYNLTVEEFIALGRIGEPIDYERVRWAAKRSGAATFIDQYPKRYAQRLGRDYKNAEEPSGGQLQKLALASLLYMQAPLMVLDEPTSAIDPEAARDFWDTLFHETPGQTVLFSTHYFGAVRRADRIVVFENGSILSQGSHQDLMKSCAVYRALFESQARDFRTES